MLDANNSLLHNMTPLHGFGGTNNHAMSNSCSNHPSNLSSSFSSRQISGISGAFPPGASTSSSPLRGFSGKVMSPSGILRSSPGHGVMPMQMPVTSPGAMGFMRSSPNVSARYCYLQFDFFYIFLFIYFFIFGIALHRERK